jgi:hypothetical protein
MAYSKGVTVQVSYKLFTMEHRDTDSTEGNTEKRREKKRREKRAEQRKRKPTWKWGNVEMG